ncbi:AcrR family transcriptional regulator [Methylobacterium sp. BE186]|uniref:TetR/AcrR family transcriptional regulator n=1 Tax=Methylobacterium sp. BE186 TaxID=2817715 RepID=UPI00285D7ADB|nr:helix-turn-helix domain-containing protein [Methylobacterium sp. BE186]MDR7037138.1 AcrR family transcriptional regulator [Methylobacterium sp. BE186]
MAKARSRRENRPEIILDAAEALLRRSGSRTLTIDAVAAEAELSKGGVLHHYASKDALITALAARKVERLRAGIGQHAAALAETRARMPLAMIGHAREVYAEESGFPDSLLIASAENADAAAGFRAFLAERLRDLAEIEARPGAGAAFLFAILGLMMSRSLGFHELDGAELDRLFGALEAQARALPEE